MCILFIFGYVSRIFFFYDRRGIRGRKRGLVWFFFFVRFIAGGHSLYMGKRVQGHGVCIGILHTHIRYDDDNGSSRLFLFRVRIGNKTVRRCRFRAVTSRINVLCRSQNTVNGLPSLKSHALLWRIRRTRKKKPNTMRTSNKRRATTCVYLS